MTNDFFNHYIFARTFQCTSSECLTNVIITVKVANKHIVSFFVSFITKCNNWSEIIELSETVIVNQHVNSTYNQHVSASVNSNQHVDSTCQPTRQCISGSQPTCRFNTQPTRQCICKRQATCQFNTPTNT